MDGVGQPFIVVPNVILWIALAAMPIAMAMRLRRRARRAVERAAKTAAIEERRRRKREKVGARVVKGRVVANGVVQTEFRVSAVTPQTASREAVYASPGHSGRMECCTC